jgi:hypothetical protein
MTYRFRSTSAACTLRKLGMMMRRRRGRRCKRLECW